MVVGLLGNESSDSNRFTLVTPKSENDVRLQATLGNQNPTGLPVGVVSYHYPKLSAENFICHYLKKRLDKVFKIEYESRSTIINLLFNTIPALKNMNDFVIIQSDFNS